MTLKREVGFPGSSECKESACNAGDPGSIPELGRSPEKEMTTHSSILEWEIPRPWGCKESDMSELLSLSLEGGVSILF